LFQQIEDEEESSVRNFFSCFVDLFLCLEMIGENIKIEFDWGEFEIYATNGYVRSLIKGSSMTTNPNSNRLRGQEQVKSNDSTINDFRSVVEEVSAMKKSLVDLRAQSEEV
jgi:hypothetical protein